MELRNLKKLAEQLQDDFKARFLAEDIELPLAFKKNVEGYGDYRFEYKRYMVHIKSSTLDGYIPNVWFFIASYFVDYYLELQKYKQLLTEALTEAGIADKTKRENLMARYPKLSDEKIKSLDKKDKDRESKVILKQEEAVIEIKKEIDDYLSKTKLSENEKDLLSKFVSDYRWWHGGKTIDRGDFYVSPILTLSNVVNASHSYIADLCKFLAEQKTYAAMLRYPNAIAIESTLPTFFIKVFTHLYKNNNKLISLFEHVSPGSHGSSKYAYDYAGNRQTNFWVKGEDNYNKCRKGDFYDNPFEYNGEKYYLSLELAKKRPNSNEVSFYGLKPIIESLYQEYTLVEESDVYIFISNKPMNYITSPLQQIFYGAPGTGKSNTIKKEVEDKGRIHFRTTFHPDSDYSTFVGCYKPTMVEAPVRDGSGHEVKEAKQEEKNRISYSFVPQSFTKAYCEAWNKYGESENAEPVFLIIEEINRGNCAQIFGDLFQLLDRETNGERCGYSTYPIDADEDLKAFLESGTKKDGTPWLTNKDGIKDGKICLPPNLYIWATMNTSDQSLFPIDSAFKRRWDWKYVPIDTAKENWNIKVNNNNYSWTNFLDVINEKIYAKTQSEDKQLGFYFCKAEGNVISAEKFVGKVLFYIYNDVYKDYGFDEDFFIDKTDNKKLTFRSFYNFDGSINERKVEAILKNLNIGGSGNTSSTEDKADTEEN